MHYQRGIVNFHLVASRNLLPMAAAAALFLSLTRGARAQSVDFEPAALAKQRADICLKATHSPVADLESEVNHLAVLSETCRAEYGAKACGLTDKPLASDKLEDRYAYYVRRPVEKHTNSRPAKINRHVWEGQADPASR